MRCRALPRREIRRRGLGAAFAQLPHAELAVEQFTGLRRTSTHHALRRTLALAAPRARSRQAQYLDQRLSAPRQLRHRRARLRSLPLGHRPHAERRRGRSPCLDRFDLAEPRPASDRASDHRARHAGSRARRAARRLHPRRHAGSIIPRGSFGSITSSLPLKDLGRAPCHLPPKFLRRSRRRLGREPKPCSSSLSRPGLRSRQ